MLRNADLITVFVLSNVSAIDSDSKSFILEGFYFRLKLARAMKALNSPKAKIFN